jgi:hypothetical protein
VLLSPFFSSLSTPRERVRVRGEVEFYIFYSPFKKIKKLLTMKFDFFIFPVRTGRSGFALRLIF